MQSAFIGISQVVPINDKLKTKEKIAKNDYEISKYLLEDKKLEYKSKIYEYVYYIKLVEKRLALYEEFKINTQDSYDDFLELCAELKKENKQILNIEFGNKSLEEMFLKITKQDLRD